MDHYLLLNSDRANPLRAISKIGGAFTHVIVASKYSDLPFYASDRIRVYCVDDLRNLLQVESLAISILRSHPLSRIIAATEKSVPTGGYLRSVLNMPGMDAQTAINFSNKYVMKARLSDAGIPVAEFRHVPSETDIVSAAADLGWPVLLKPAYGSGSVDFVSLAGPSDLKSPTTIESVRRLFNLAVPILMERYVDIVREYHCDGVVENGGVSFAKASRYLRPCLQTRGGVAAGVHLKDSDPIAKRIMRLHEESIAALGIRDGVTHLEVLETADSLMVGEIAARPGGGSIPLSLAASFGIDIWEAFVCTNIGVPWSKPDPRASRDSGGVQGYASLPARNGVVVSLTPEEELLEIEGSKQLQYVCSPGDKLSSRESAVFFSCYIHFELESEESIPRYLDQLASIYKIEVK